MSIVFAASIVAISVFVKKLTKTRKFYTDLPTPPHTFFWGNPKVLGKAYASFPRWTYVAAVFDSLVKSSQSNGTLYFDLWPFSTSMIFISDPALATQIQTNPAFDRHQVSIDAMIGLVGTQSILSSRGKEWQQQRSWFAPAFSMSHLLTLLPGMIEEALRFRNRLTEITENNTQVKMVDELGRFTIDVIGRSVGDINVNALAGYSPIRYYFLKCAATMSTPSDAPWRRIIQKMRHTWYTWRLDQLLKPIINEKLSTEISGKSILILAQKGFLKHRADLLGEKGTVQEGKEFQKLALDNTKAFMLAGLDTMTSTLCYIFYLLSKHPDIRSRLQDEHNKVLGASLESTLATLKDTPQAINTLPLTAAVVKETLRLFPIGFTIRQASPGTTLTFKGRDYPMTNHMIAVFNPQTQRNPEFWCNPNDFQPDRWLETEQSDAGKDNGAYAPFEKGRRDCIGQQFATIEMKLVMVLVVRWFDFEACFEGNTEIPGWGGEAYQEFELNAKPKQGMPSTYTALFGTPFLSENLCLDLTSSIAANVDFYLVQAIANSSTFL